MNLENELEKLAERLNKFEDTISTEEASKTSIVLPFLQLLGYDVFDPSEVIPEFTADAVGKRGEKVDYAIASGGEIAILVECKSLNTKLEKKHLAQLYRYFSVTRAKFAILTNGRTYEFYSDLDETNRLDAKPFFVFELTDLNSSSVSELRKFEKQAFDVERILANAERLKYVSAVKKFLAAEFEEPSSETIRLVASHVHDGRITAQIREVIGNATKVAFRELVRETVQARLSSALESNQEVAQPEEPLTSEAVDDGIETTDEEIEGMMTVRAIVSKVIDPNRIGLRDAKSYCAILVDDNNRKPLARMHFNRKQWYIGLFDGESEERIAITSLTDIFGFSDRLLLTAKKYVD